MVFCFIGIFAAPAMEEYGAIERMDAAALAVQGRRDRRKGNDYMKRALSKVIRGAAKI